MRRPNPPLLALLLLPAVPVLGSEEAIDCLQEESNAPAFVEALASVLGDADLASPVQPNAALQLLLAGWSAEHEDTFYNLAFATVSGDFYGMHMCHGALAKRKYCQPLPEDAIVFTDGMHGQSVAQLYTVEPSCVDNAANATGDCIGPLIWNTTSVQIPANLPWYNFSQTLEAGQWGAELITGQLAAPPGAIPDKLIYTEPAMADGVFVGAAMALAEMAFHGCSHPPEDELLDDDDELLEDTIDGVASEGLSGGAIAAIAAGAAVAVALVAGLLCFCSRKLAPPRHGGGGQGIDIALGK